MADILEATLDSEKIEEAINRWINAFDEMGLNGSQEFKHPIDEMGIEIRSTVLERNGNYWNALYYLVDGISDEQATVEVNPPKPGAQQSNYQGVVAYDGGRKPLILHRGQMTVTGFAPKLQNFKELHGLSTHNVLLKNGKIEECFLVCDLCESPKNIVIQTRRFLDACLLVRIWHQQPSDQARDILESNLFNEESVGSFLRRAREAQRINRVHGPIVNALKDQLVNVGHFVSNKRVGSLGPDLYTTNTQTPLLFEIKPDYGASDYLKAVGQLLVYERHLGKKFQKYAVFPEGIPTKLINILSDLNISVIQFRLKGDKFHFFDLPTSKNIKKYMN